MDMSSALITLYCYVRLSLEIFCSANHKQAGNEKLCILNKCTFRHSDITFNNDPEVFFVD